VITRWFVILAMMLGGSLLVNGQPGAHNPAKPEILTIPLLPEGFVTPQVTIPAGVYVIDVLNRSGIRGIKVEVDRMTGASVDGNAEKHEADGQDDKYSARFLKSVNLTAGTYRVRIIGYPKWVFAVNVK
jgi:hypothetical protein